MAFLFSSPFSQLAFDPEFTPDSGPSHSDACPSTSSSSSSFSSSSFSSSSFSSSSFSSSSSSSSFGVASSPRPNAVHHHVNFLVQGGVSSVFFSPSLSRALLRNAVAISLKHSLRLHPELKWGACKNCWTPYVPGVSCCVRLETPGRAACREKRKRGELRKRKARSREARSRKTPETDCAEAAACADRAVSHRRRDRGVSQKEAFTARNAQRGPWRGEAGLEGSSEGHATEAEAEDESETPDRETGGSNPPETPVEKKRRSVHADHAEEGSREKDAACLEKDRESQKSRTRRSIRRAGMTLRIRNRNRRERERTHHPDNSDTTDSFSVTSPSSPSFPPSFSSPSDSSLSASSFPPAGLDCQSRGVAPGRDPRAAWARAESAQFPAPEDRRKVTERSDTALPAFVFVTCLSCGVSRRRGAVAQTPLEEETAER
ncbi:conserved hypothetical protein [Neospora caninum Liverpool]|uniref:Uncharacterized protein n=1 Tax=Neospora caninum (strain Liverpool) TaxID=572307 RepID=F0VKI1_NEOCL|nr:conserved hypothetical protein [Neospora caninum Liverpool]CBZ54582.1 conserved hypothetical protein [Neospora caninum Liverpool]CEL69295.1 TPA: hypothetical protein BN1204_050100 [Neospora caninum Liverpool]|eukprot:XP_003884612.1 conserved hypothetical protein [Neospora caninum Liverpool]